MRTITINIINHKALRLLKELELLQLIQLDPTKQKNKKSISKNWITPFEGAMPKQPLTEVNQQLQELRNGWE
jgi:hypothetical protein